MNSQDSLDNQKSSSKLSVGSIFKILLYPLLFGLGVYSLLSFFMGGVGIIVFWGIGLIIFFVSSDQNIVVKSVGKIVSIIELFIIGNLLVYAGIYEILWRFSPPLFCHPSLRSFRLRCLLIVSVIWFISVILVFLSYKYSEKLQLLSSKRLCLWSFFIGLTITVIFEVFGVPDFFRAQRSRETPDAGRQSDIGQLGVACEAYYSRNGFYPQELSDLTLEGDLKQIPIDNEDCSDYSYVVDEETNEIAIYDKMESSGDYWAYKGVNRKYTARYGKACEFEELSDAADPNIPCPP